MKIIMLEKKGPGKEALRELCLRSDVVVVINDGIRVYGTGGISGAAMAYANRPEDLNPRWFICAETVGIAPAARARASYVKAVCGRVRMIGENFRFLKKYATNRIAGFKRRKDL